VETSSVVQVFLLALLTAVATGIGALPFLFVKGLTRRWLGVSNALACGLMLAASFGLIYEGVAYSLWRALLGVVLGLGFIVLTRTLIQHEEHPVVLAQMGGLDARKALLIVGVITVHSFTEGVGIGVSFGGGEAFGLFISVALAVHNVPEGLAISLVLVHLDGENVDRVAISLCGGDETPVRARKAEEVVVGNVPSEEVFEEAAEAAAPELNPLPDPKGSPEYRRKLAKVYIRRALDLAVRRAKGEGQ